MRWFKRKKKSKFTDEEKYIEADVLQPLNLVPIWDSEMVNRRRIHFETNDAIFKQNVNFLRAEAGLCIGKKHHMKLFYPLLKSQWIHFTCIHCRFSYSVHRVAIRNMLLYKWPWSPYYRFGSRWL